MTTRPRSPVTRSAVHVVIVMGAFAATVVSQSPRREPRVLLGSQVVDCATGAVLGGVGSPEKIYLAYPQWSSPNSVSLQERTIDPDAAEVLVVGDRLRLLSLDGREAWAVDAAMLAPKAAHYTAPRCLAGDRVLLPHADGGLVALDRRTGAVAWHRPELPVDFVRVDAGLVVAAGVVAGRPRLHAVALENGASAFDCVVPGPIGDLVVGSHGIAIVDLDGFTVHDRAGPRLFEVAHTPEELWAGPEGWFGFRRGTLSRWSRTGECVGTMAIGGNDTKAEDLTVLADGSVMLSWSAAKAPATLFVSWFEADGTCRWQARIDDAFLHPTHALVSTRVIGSRVLLVCATMVAWRLLEVDTTNGDFTERARTPLR